MRNDLPTISESADELRLQIESTTKKRMKQRLQALYLIQSGGCLTREAVAASLGVHRHTVSRWLSKYEAGGISELLEIRTRPNRKRVIPAKIYLALEQELRSAPEQFSNYREVQTWLHDRFGLDVKYKTLYRLVRYELKIDIAGGTAKAPAKKAVTRTEKAVTAAQEASKSGQVPEIEFDETEAPTVANFFRSIALFLEGDSVDSADVTQAVRAANAVLNASPPYGEFGAGSRTYIPAQGGRLQRRKREARRELRGLQSFVNKAGVTAEQTRTLLNRLADQFDAVGDGLHRIAEDRDGIGVLGAVAAHGIATDEPAVIFLDEPQEASDSTAQQGSGSDSAPASEFIVLYAEDDDMAASIVKRQLGKHSASVVRAKTSIELLEILNSETVDLVILNARLGGEDGLELLRTLRDDPAYDNVPIVAVGWAEDSADEGSVLRYGADAYVTKPFSPVEFTSTVMRLLIAARTSVQRREDRAPTRWSRSNAETRRAEEGLDEL